MHAEEHDAPGTPPARSTPSALDSWLTSSLRATWESGSKRSSVSSVCVQSSCAVTRATTLPAPTVGSRIDSMRLASSRSRRAWWRMAPLGAGPWVPSGSGASSRPRSSTTDTRLGSRPSTLDATRCTTPRACPGWSSAPGRRRTTTEALAALDRDDTKPRRSGMATCTRARSTDSSCSMLRASSPWSARWKLTRFTKSDTPKPVSSKISKPGDPPPGRPRPARRMRASCTCTAGT